MFAPPCSVLAPGDWEPRAIDLSPLLETDESVSPVEAAALRILSDLQDEVIESLAAAWPRDATHSGPANPYATAGARLDLGYRYADEPDNPVLALEPIPLDNIETGP